MKVKQTNADIRKYMEDNVVRQWEVAEKLAISEAALSKLFRHELDVKTKSRVLEAIESIIADHLKED